jgi:stearoyl-CoA desaturase (delta-9 desaturase)
MDEHPGGRHLLKKNIGKDATTAFFGGVYDHSNAAHNVRSCHLEFYSYLLTLDYQLLAMMRVGVLRGGLEIESEKAIPPSQHLQIIRGQALAILKEDAKKDSAKHLQQNDSEAGPWRDDQALPSPPLSTNPLNSEDELSSGECRGLNLSRK